MIAAAVALALAAMKKIRQAHAKAHITLLTTPPFEALARMSPYFNSIETDGRPDDVGDLTKMLGRLRAADLAATLGRVMGHPPGKDLLEDFSLGMAEMAADGWRWRLKSANGENGAQGTGSAYLPARYVS